jgi:predicted NACHT family NTPase
MTLFESAIGGIAVSILDNAIKAGKYAANEIEGAYSDVQHKQRVLAASQAYTQNYLDRHCQIKIMPGLMKKPLDLESIYTAVKLLNDSDIQAFRTTDDLKETFRAKRKRGFGISSEEPVNGMKVANDEPFLMVLGGPGIGKSTFLRKIGLEALKLDGYIQRKCIPVFLELKKFREETLDIEQEIVKEFDICQFPAAAALVKSALDEGKLLILLDGLDEVPSRNLDKVIDHIENFVDKYSQNSFVASCRIAAYRSSFRRFRDVTIADFDDDQIEQFIKRWFSSTEDQSLEVAEKYWEMLNQSEHKATKELAQTPLLLTFLCLIYDRKQMLPSKRSTLYGNALDIILYEWSAQKRIGRDSFHEKLYPDLEKILLAEIAYESFRQDELFFSKETITTHISNFLADTIENPKYLNADAVLTAIVVQQGILVKRATDAYSFSHLTLQEYLTAQHIVEKQLEEGLVRAHLTDESWREVFLLVSGVMKSRASQLFKVIEQQAQTYIQPYEKVKELVRWAAINEVGKSELHQRSAMLAIASAFAIDSARSIDSARTSAFAIDSTRASASARARAIDSARTSARAIDSARTIYSARARTIDRAIEHHFLNAQSMQNIATKLSTHQKNLPSSDAPSADWRNWANQLQLIWLEALNLNSDFVSFSSGETRALSDYLYATELLIRCKESAIGVSRSDWKAMEARLLTVVEDIEES